MHVEIDPIINTNEFWAKAVQHGNTILEKMMRSFQDQAMIRWTAENDETGRPRLTVELSVSTGGARARLSDAELTDDYEFRWRLNETWHSALGNALEKKLQRIDQLLQEEAIPEHAR